MFERILILQVKEKKNSSSLQQLAHKTPIELQTSTADSMEAILRQLTKPPMFLFVVVTLHLVHLQASHLHSSKRFRGRANQLQLNMEQVAVVILAM